MYKYLRHIILLFAFLTLFCIMNPEPVKAFRAEDDINVSINIAGGGGKTPYTADIHVTGIKATEKKESYNLFLKQYKGVIIGVSGIATLTFVVLFIVSFMRLGASAGNPQQRHEALVALLWTGLASAGCASVAIFVGMSYGLLSEKGGMITG